MKGDVSYLQFVLFQKLKNLPQLKNQIHTARFLSFFSLRQIPLFWYCMSGQRQHGNVNVNINASTSSGKFPGCRAGLAAVVQAVLKTLATLRAPTGRTRCRAERAESKTAVSGVPVSGVPVCEKGKGRGGGAFEGKLEGAAEVNCKTKAQVQGTRGKERTMDGIQRSAAGEGQGFIATKKKLQEGVPRPPPLPCSQNLGGLNIGPQKTSSCWRGVHIPPLLLT